MHARRDHHVGAGRHGRTPARWRAAAAAVVAPAALSVAAGAVAASAAGGYTVTATITVGFYPDAVAVNLGTDAAYVANTGGTVSVISPEPAGPVSGPILSGSRADKCVADSGDSTTNDTPITLATCNGSPSQDWTVTTSGTLRANGKCLDIYRDEKTNKAPVELWTCTGGANQQWQATAAGTLVNPVSGKCLDDPKLTTPSTQLEIYTCDGSANQRWKIP
jgi:beta-glucosidase